MSRFKFFFCGCVGDLRNYPCFRYCCPPQAQLLSQQGHTALHISLWSPWSLFASTIVTKTTADSTDKNLLHDRGCKTNEDKLRGGKIIYPTDSNVCRMDQFSTGIRVIRFVSPSCDPSRGGALGHHCSAAAGRSAVRILTLTVKIFTVSRRETNSG